MPGMPDVELRLKGAPVQIAISKNTATKMREQRNIGIQDALRAQACQPPIRPKLYDSERETFDEGKRV